MRRLIVISFTTLDGVMQAPGGPEEDTSGGFRFGGWQAPFPDELVGQALGDVWDKPFDLLLGRRTFEIFAGYWPYHAEEEPGAGINKATKYVASHTLRAHNWQKSVFLNGDVAEEVRKLKHGDGPQIIMYGSANLIQTLLKHDLVDEIVLMIYPITLGMGKRLFAEGTMPAAFKVTKGQVSAMGVVVLNLERAGEVKTGTVGE